MALPSSVSAELASFGTDALVVAGAVLVALVAIYAVKFLRRSVGGSGLGGGSSSSFRAGQPIGSDQNGQKIVFYDLPNGKWR